MLWKYIVLFNKRASLLAWAMATFHPDTTDMPGAAITIQKNSIYGQVSYALHFVNAIKEVVLRDYLMNI
jgi:hypothetical protein